MSETPVSQGTPEDTPGTEEVQGSQEEVSVNETSSTENTDSINPAWSELLEVVPSMLHSQVTPHLKKWDQNYQTGISKVHSQYEPYKQFVENKVDPGQLDYGYQLVQALENKPAEVIDALITFARDNDIQLTSLQQQQLENAAQNAEQGLDENDISANPQVQQLMQQVEMLKQQVEQSSQEKEIAAAEKQLDADLAALRERYGEFDEDWVFTKCLNDPKADLEAAVKAYKDFENSVAERVKTAAPGAPQVLGSGGGNPTAGLEPPKTEADRKSRIKSILEGARQAEQG